MSKNTVVPRHLTIDGRELVAGEPSGGRAQKPRVIDYTHTIRMLDSASCDHDEVIRKMQIHYERELKAKEEMIRQLQMGNDQTGEEDEMMTQQKEDLRKREEDIRKREDQLVRK